MDDLGPDLRTVNLSIARRWMTTLFAPDWWDLMHEAIVLEFPYGPSIQAPDRVVGRAAATAYCLALAARAGALAFDVLEITETKDPSVFVCEYEADRKTPNGAAYRQVYINRLKVEDGKIILMREFWDPKKILDAAA